MILKRVGHENLNVRTKHTRTINGTTRRPSSYSVVSGKSSSSSSTTTPAPISPVPPQPLPSLLEVQSHFRDPTMHQFTIFSSKFTAWTTRFCFSLLCFYFSIYTFFPVCREVDRIILALAFICALTVVCLVAGVNSKIVTNLSFAGATACVFVLDYVTKGTLMCSSTLSMMGIYSVAFMPPFFPMVTYLPAVMLYFGLQSWIGEERFFGHQFDHVVLPASFQVLCRIMFTCIFPSTLMMFSYVTFRSVKCEAMEEIRKSSEAKSAFIDYLSHEMRNSLQIIVSSVEFHLFEDGKQDRNGDISAAPGINSKVLVPRSTLRDLQTAAAHATRIVDDVLTLEKVEQMKLTMEMEPFDVEKWMKHILQSYSANIAQKNLTLAINTDESDAHHNCRIIGDKHRIRQIICNFVSNAIKFTSEGGKISVTWNLHRVAGSSAANKETFLEICVEDDGIGISIDDQKTKLFQSFAQLRAGRMLACGGSGLGLAICKEIAKLHGGNVGCISTEGVGSIFWMRVKVREEIQTVPKFPNNGIDISATAEKPRIISRFEDLRILVVDDQIINTKLVQRTLTRLGVPAESITCVHDGDEMVAFVRSAKENKEEFEQCGVIFLDHEMPRMNGSEALKIVRAEGFQGHVVGLTGNSSGSSQESFMNAGLDDIIIKPFRFDDVKRVLKSFAED